MVRVLPASPWRRIAQACSFAGLVLLPTWARLLDPEWQASGQLQPPSYQAALVVAAIAALSAWIGIGLAELLERRSRAVANVLRVLTVLGLLLYCARPILPVGLVAIHGATPVFVGAGILLAAFTLAILWRHDAAAAVARVVLLIFFPFALLAFAQAAIGAGRGLRLASPGHIHAKVSRVANVKGMESSPRVLLILFDELDYGLAFDRPLTPLPNFDRLRSESLFATSAFAAGPATAISVPTMMTGRPVKRSSRLPNDYMLEFQDGDHRRYGEGDNLFRNLRAVGRTSLRLNGIPAGGGAGDADTIIDLQANVRSPSLKAEFSSIVVEMLVRLPFSTLINVQTIFDPFPEFAAKFDAESGKTAAKIGAAGNFNFAYLHIMMPHEPFVFDRERRKFTAEIGLDYADNVAGADFVLGQIRAAMVNSGTWDKTSVIVLADHWYRKHAALSAEPDHRVPFIVKLARQTSGRTFDEPINAIVLHDLVMAIESGRVSTADDLVGLLRQSEFKGELPATRALRGRERRRVQRRIRGLLTGRDSAITIRRDREKAKRQTDLSHCARGALARQEG